MSNFHKIIISISSDIGFYLAKDWLSNGIRVSGTYRIRTNHCDGPCQRQLVVIMLIWVNHQLSRLLGMVAL